MLNSQSNTQVGLLPKPAAADLTGKEGRLLRLIAGSKLATVGLPAAITDRVSFVCDDGNTIGEPANCLPLAFDRNIRVRAKGTGTGGAPLCLAAIAGDDAGKLRTVPATTGTYHILAIAEENFVDDQLVLVRFTGREAVIVP